ARKTPPPDQPPPPADEGLDGARPRSRQPARGAVAVRQGHSARQAIRYPDADACDDACDAEAVCDGQGWVNTEASSSCPGLTSREFLSLRAKRSNPALLQQES